MQLLKTSAFAPATPDKAASRSHSYASRLNVFVLPVPSFGTVLAPLLLRLAAGAGGYARGATHPAKRIIAAMTPNLTKDLLLKIFTPPPNEVIPRP